MAAMVVVPTVLKVRGLSAMGVAQAFGALFEILMACSYCVRYGVSSLTLKQPSSETCQDW